MQAQTDSAKGGVDLIESRLVLNVENAVNLRQMPVKTPREFGLADSLIPHPLVEDEFHGGHGAQGHANTSF